MEFGKRGVPRRSGAPSRSDLDGETLDLPGSRAGEQEGLSGPALTVAMVLASVVIGVAAALVYGLLFAGPQSNSAAAAGPQGSAAHDRIAATCMPPAGKGLRRVGVTDEQYRYQGALISPAYFTCALALERERFCGAEEKALLVKELQTYFAHIAAKQRIIDAYANDPQAKAMMKTAAAINGDDGGITTRAVRPEPDHSVVAMLQGLVREGYLRAGDFGWSVPPEIAMHIKGVEKTKASC